MIILIPQVKKEECYLLEAERARTVPNRPVTLRYWNVFNSFSALDIFIIYLLICYCSIKKINNIRTANIMEISDITVENMWHNFWDHLTALLSIYCCSVAQLCPTFCDFMDCSTPGFLVLHHLLELAQTHVHWVMLSNHLIVLVSISSSLPKISQVHLEQWTLWITAIVITFPGMWSPVGLRKHHYKRS